LRPLASQFGRFAIVGASNTLVSAALYVALGSSALAFAAGAVNGYVWNARWTFGARGSTIRYLAVALAGLGLTVAITSAAGYVVALPAVTVATFAANRAWVFARGGRSPRWTTTRSPRVSTSTPRCSSSPARGTTRIAPTAARRS
jgi:putative flippase GtrA